MREYYIILFLFHFLFFNNYSLLAEASGDTHIHNYYGPVSQTFVDAVSKSHSDTTAISTQMSKEDINLEQRSDNKINVEQQSIINQIAMIEQLQDLKENTKKHMSNFSNFLKEYALYYKWYLIGGTIIFIYGGTHYILWKAKKYIQRDDLWSCWKQLLSFEELLLVPHDELEKELLKDIQSRYINLKKPNDFLFSLISFIQDIDDEIKKLRFYRRYYTWFGKSYLRKTILINLSFLNLVSEKIQKLLFLKNIFSSLVSQYKIKEFKLSTVSDS